MSTTTGIKLDDETRKRLRKLGEKRGRSSHWLMKQAISDYIEKEELNDLDLGIEEDLRRLKHYKETGEYISHDEVKAWLQEVANGNFVKPSWLK